MVSLGSTSDIIVATLLVLSQLIKPVPETAVANAERALSERQSCLTQHDQKRLYQERGCELLKEDRRRYKEECQGLENAVALHEVQCATDALAPAVLRFRPRPIADYLTLSNQELVQELHLICNALQDRVFLEPEEWMNGVMANRDDLSSKFVILQKPELQTVLSSVLKEASDGSLDAGVAFKVVTALCHWKVDRTALAEKIDFTGGYHYLRGLISELPRVERLPELPQASFVYDDRDQRIGEIYDMTFVTRRGKNLLGRLSRRRTVGTEQIPPMLMNAFVAIEDKRFWQHNGFDFEAVKRLYYGGMRGSAQGGSTFTMQIAKNAFFSRDVEMERSDGKRSLRRKLKEILLIPQIEARYRKEEILTYYLNLINLTPNAQGVLMAALDLFNKADLNQLTLGEMALLAALPKGTSSYNPWRFPDAAKARRDTVIQALYDQGYISRTDKEQALLEPLNLADQVGAARARVFSRYFTGHITNHFRSLKRANLRDPRWTLGGFDIKTAFNLELQAIVTGALQQGLLNYEKFTAHRYKWKPWTDSNTGKNVNVALRMDRPRAAIMDVFESLRLAHPYPETNWVIALKIASSSRWLLENGQTVNVADTDRKIFGGLKNYDAVLLERKEHGSYQLAAAPEVQGAAVVLDIQTGDVLALSGGFSAGPYGKFAQNNRVTRSLRQPGSTIKPITYLYALNHGVQPNQVLRNNTIRFPKIEHCGYEWAPKNYGGEGGSRLTVRSALEHSMNRSTVNLFVRLAGMPEKMAISGDLSEATPEQRNHLKETLYGIYDLAVKFGMYPDRDFLTEHRMQAPCFPFLLGGVETTPLNMAQAYAAIANGGLRRDAVFLRQVFKGRVPLLVDHSSERRDQVHEYRAAVKQGYNAVPEAFGAIPGVTPASVAQLRSLMQGVLRRGTAARIKHWADVMAGKTGTTNDSKDVWFAGYTNKIVVVVWVGYDSNHDFEDLGKVTGASVALPIFQEIMEGYFKLKPEEGSDPLPPPTEIPGVTHAKVDLESGHVYADDSDGSCATPPSWAIDEYLTQASQVAGAKKRCHKHAPVR